MQTPNARKNAARAYQRQHPGTPYTKALAAVTPKASDTATEPQSQAIEAALLAGTDGAGHKSVQQAASEAGFKLPPLGQDIGQELVTADLKPGDVVMGANNHNAVFLGEVDGKAMTITEQGEVTMLDEVNNYDGPH